MTELTTSHLVDVDGEGSAEHGWEWLREAGGRWRAERDSGELRVAMDAGSLWGDFGRENPASNTLVRRHTDAGGAEVYATEVSVVAVGEDFGEQAGLFWLSAGDGGAAGGSTSIDDGVWVKLVVERLKRGRKVVFAVQDAKTGPRVVAKVDLPPAAVRDADAPVRLRLEVPCSTGRGAGEVDVTAFIVGAGEGGPATDLRVGTAPMPFAVERALVGVGAHGGPKTNDREARFSSWTELSRRCEPGSSATELNITAAFGPAVSAPERLLQVALAAERHCATRDVYGKGESLGAFEEEIAAALGKEAGVFVISGVMAQLIACRLHTDAASAAKRCLVALHPSSHLELHEEGALGAVMRLDHILIGGPQRVLTAEDIEEGLRGSEASTSVVIVELPQRHNGGETTPFDDLLRLRAWADTHGIKLHMDGARLWEVAPYYGRPLAEIAALFDSVYVSFYKGLGGLAGAMLLGSKAFVDEARPWIRRMGGNLYTVLPYEVAAREGWRRYGDSFAARFEKAQRVVRQITEACLDGHDDSTMPFSFAPASPQSCLVHVRFPEGMTCEVAVALADRVAAETGVRVFVAARLAFAAPERAYFEWNFGPASLGVDDACFVRGWRRFAELVAEWRAGR